MVKTARVGIMTLKRVKKMVWKIDISWLLEFRNGKSMFFATRYVASIYSQLFSFLFLFSF